MAVHPKFSVLCPVDFSSPSGLALRYAAALAGRFGGRLTVLFVEDPLLASAAAVASDERAVATASNRELRRFISQSIGRDLASPVEGIVSIGNPAREIEKAAKRLGHDVIVMGSHGRSGAKRLFFGSTTSEVLKRASVPVLVVPRTAAGKPPAVWG